MYLSSAGLVAFSWIGDYMAAIKSVAGTKLQAPLIFQMSAEGLVRCLLTAWIMWSYALAGFFVVTRWSHKDRVFAVLCFAATVPIVVFVGRPSTFPIELLTAVGAQLLILFGGGTQKQPSCRTVLNQRPVGPRGAMIDAAGLFLRIRRRAIKLIESSFSVRQIRLLRSDLLAQSFHLCLNGGLHQPFTTGIYRETRLCFFQLGTLLRICFYPQAFFELLHPGIS